MSENEPKLQYTIRDMNIDDLAPVYHLGNDVFSENLPMLYRTWDSYEVTTLYNTDPDTCLVASHNGKVVGFALGTIIEKGTAWSYGYIVWLGVNEEWRRQKVAHRLVRALEKRMLDEGVRMFLVDTSERNKKAIRFFEQEGFEVGEKHVYLSKTLEGDAEERKRKRKPRTTAQTRKQRKSTEQKTNHASSEGAPKAKNPKKRTKSKATRKNNTTTPNS